MGGLSDGWGVGGGRVNKRRERVLGSLSGHIMGVFWIQAFVQRGKKRWEFLKEA